MRFRNPKNEWISRLIYILTPCIFDGLKVYLMKR